MNMRHLIKTIRAQRRDMRLMFEFFDSKFYAEQLSTSSPKSNRALLRHYLTEGWRGGLDPNPEFSTNYYLESNPDIQDKGLNPFVHYLRHGRAEGRHPTLQAAECAFIAPEFDVAFYRAQRPDLAEWDEAALLRHYLTEGWRGGLDPNSEFSTNYYLESNPDIQDKGLNPFVHYLRHGRAEGRHPTLQAAECAFIAPEFDVAFYRAQRPDLAEWDEAALLRHYLTDGWQEGLDPSPDFSTTAYLETYSDVKQLGMNPFLHYLRYGRAEGRQSCPQLPHKAALAVMRTYFDPDFYRAQTPEMHKKSDDELLTHYQLHGWREGYDPARNFSTKFYLKTHPDIRARGINPFFHYLSEGQREGRQVKPAGPREWSDLSSDQIARLMKLFATDWYLSMLPEATTHSLGSSEAALQHYVTTGWREGLDPSSDFSTEYYLETYRDTRGVCPLVHFLLHDHLAPRRPCEGAPRWLEHAPDRHPLPQYVFPLPQQPSAPLAPLRSRASEGLDLHWVIPDFGRGGGGHMTIFRMIRYLEGFGHACTIWIDRPIHHMSAKDAYEDVVLYFQCVAAQVRFLSDGFEQATGDAVIATGWSTAYWVQAARGFSGRFYFVQDYETAFYPEGSERYLAEQTYHFDLACICASPWLEKKLHEEYGRFARSFNLAHERGIYDLRRGLPDFDYRLTGQSQRHKIAVYAREHTPRRCVQLAVMALAELGRLRDDFEVHFFGQNELSFQACNFRAFNHGTLNETELAQLYNECDLALCFSATNYSLVPQEMMACGLPLIELDGESTRAIFPDGVVTFAGPDPRDIAAKADTLLNSPDARDMQAVHARNWVDQFSWEDSARMVEAAFYEHLNAETGSEHPVLSTPDISRPKDVIMDVVIPTWNGMGEIEAVIESLRRQKLAGQLQIYCVDSSSTDGTTDWLRAQSDIALEVIAQSEFQHGRTRNLGASLGRAPLIGFLTQDAIPAGAHWADDLVRMMDHYEDAAGVFGRHIPYPHHSLYVRQEITRHFANMDKKPLAVSRNTDPVKWESGDRSWRQFLHFYSDNNSAMRRRIWREFPYPEIDYGEDQVWARDIISNGLVKLYAPTAAVYHSHDYSPEETYQRAKIEGQFFLAHFGYKLGPSSDAEFEAQQARETARIEIWGKRNGESVSEINRQQEIMRQKLLGLRDGARLAMNDMKQA